MCDSLLVRHPSGDGDGVGHDREGANGVDRYVHADGYGVRSKPSLAHGRADGVRRGRVRESATYNASVRVRGAGA